MAYDGSSEKGISVAFEKLSITSSDQTSNQTKNNSENASSLQSQILSAIHKIRKSKNRADVKAITKKINKSSGTSFDEGYTAVSISQLLDKKITSEDNLPFQVEEIVFDDTEQCQKHTHFIRNLLDDIINNALDNLEKSSDATKITTCHINVMPAIVH